MFVEQKVLQVSTTPKSLHNITKEVFDAFCHGRVNTGMCHLFVRHTSCSLIISENCDPDVLKDMGAFMNDLVPEARYYHHNAEGPDDTP